MNEQPPSKLVRTSDAARYLGIKPAMMRRHTATYERIYGPLPSDEGGRWYAPEVIERLEAALAAYHAGKFQSVEVSLQALASGEPMQETALSNVRPPEGLLDELRRVGDLLERQTRMLEVQGERLERLEAENAVMHEQLRALTPPSDTPPQDDERTKEVEELHRRIGYLQRELERRSPSPEARETRRLWWMVWKR